MDKLKEKQNTGKTSAAKAFRTCVAVLSIPGIICSVVVLFPETQKQIIRLAEEYLIHRKVNFYDDWMNTLFAWAKGCIALIVGFDFFVLTKLGRNLLNEIGAEIKYRLSKINIRSFVNPFFLLAGVYLLALTSIVRADFFYIDDVDRALRGYHGWNGWSRHLADILSTFIHADTNLADISPLPQFLAVLLMALGSTLLVYIFSDKPAISNKPGIFKFNYGMILASVPLGLSPYFLENLSYRFDAPYMALSVVASIIPFLFIETKKSFVFTSIVSLLVMCMSYQASSGIYILISIMILFNDWNKKRKTSKELAVFGGTAAIAFCAALVFFRLFFMVSGTTGHGVSTSMLSLARFFPGVLNNLTIYASTINADFGLAWKIIIAVLSLMFIAHSGKQSSRSVIIRFAVPVLVLVVSFCISYGVYLILENPLFLPRAFIGFGALLAIICVNLVSGNKKISLVSVLALNWCFIVFAFSYGNALTDQKRYYNFRTEMVLRDLSALFPNRTAFDPEIRLENDIGFGPFTESIARHYPLIKKLVPTNRFYQVYKYMSGYFHWQGGKEWEGEPAELPVIFDSYYHTIKSDGSHILVMFKN